jgi:hypothetical protein
MEIPFEGFPSILEPAEHADQSGIEIQVELSAVILTGSRLAQWIVVDTQGKPVHDLRKTQTRILIIGNQSIE